MRRIILIILMLYGLSIPVKATELQAPDVPDAVAEMMPSDDHSFADGLWFVVKNAIRTLGPSLAEGLRICLSVLLVSILISILRSFPGKTADLVDMAGTVAAAGVLLTGTHSLIGAATETIERLSDYGKLLLPVMAAAMAAQGGAAGATALYSGTAIFDALLSNLISSVLVPMTYIFLAVTVADNVLDSDLLQRIKDFLKWLVTWCLKTILYIFTGFISVSGVVAGSTDKTALKAAKLTISGAVPVVGGIISDASEALLVSAGMVRSSVGIYGLWAVIAIAIGPFLRIGVHYLLFKAMTAACSVFAGKKMYGLLQDFSTAMGLLLGMTGAASLLLIISTVCFMKGVG